MSARNWRPEWSTDLEHAWKSKLEQHANPRASIRTVGPTSTVAADDANRTRPLDDSEVEEIREKRPIAASTTPRRRIHVSAPGIEGQLGRTEFELATELGAGGMGRVFRAQQVSLGRDVAVKQLHTTTDMPDAAASFESEACITAVLEHPNIVPVYDMGVDQSDQVFYSMKLVEGTPWDELLDKRSEDYDLRSHLEILIEAANAVAYAHSRGVIHRDIKPQNVMVGEYGEVLLVDWGLACALEPTHDRSSRILDIGQVLITCGTPVYMPPEVSTGQREWVGPWTDVYMLGAVLFEVLYGIPPHEGATAIEALKIASRNEWSFPEQVSAELSPYHDVLRPVVQRALSTYPTSRQPDGKAFADDVRAALRHLDSAELSSEAVHNFREIESAQAERQRESRGNRSAPRSDQQQTYRTLSRVVAVLEQALSSWSDNEAARHYIVEAHLLHAFCALSNHELSLVRQQLDMLGHLPAGTVPTPEQSARAAKLKQRVEDAIATRERKRRWTKLLQLSALALALILVVGSVAASLLIGEARDQARLERNHLSRLLIGTAANGLDAELEGLLQPVRGSLLDTADWARAGRLNSDDANVLTPFFLPLIDDAPVISSVLRADDEGHEYMLLRTENGWMTRSATPDGQTTFQNLDPDGNVLGTWTEKIQYDPRTRPWYLEAMASGGEIGWTEPYTFFTTKQPGMTAAMTATNAEGRTFVLGIDMLLTDLSAFTMRMPDAGHGGEHGKVFVIDAQHRVIGLPRSPKFEDEGAKRNAVLQPLDQVGEPISARALTVWGGTGQQSEPFRFVVDGRPWWSGFRSFELGRDRSLWIGVVLPEADFPDLEE